jgi:allantoin racemase
MKILIINPNTSDEMTRAIGEAAQRYARQDTEIETVRPDFGPRSLENAVEVAVATHATVQKVMERRGQQDAVVIACGGDPGLYAVRQLLEEPVIGIGEAAYHFACMLGYKFSILIPLADPTAERLVSSHGLVHRLASIRVVDIPVLELESDLEVTKQRLIAEGRRAVHEDGAEVLCLGCAGMALMDKAVEEAVGVPVLDGTVCAVKMAEGMYDYGLKTSKVAAFKRPDSKEYVGCSDLYDNV